ncbi:hypothetical protein B5F87_13695 [Eubacterium sp. An3]|nr:hypothetical protein B5F87_13695 [Eubacterium sp. An3]
MEENVYLFDDTFLLLAYGVCREPQIIKYADYEVKELVWIKGKGEEGHWRIELKYTRKPRIIVAGSRNFTDYSVVEKVLQDYLKTYPWEVEMISGTAKGADLLGERFASTYGYKIVRFPANWTRYGKSAGPIRNEEMAKYAAKEYGVLFAFWNGSSRGTKSMIEFAKQYGLEIHIIPINQSIKK